MGYLRRASNSDHHLDRTHLPPPPETNPTRKTNPDRIRVDHDPNRSTRCLNQTCHLNGQQTLSLRPRTCGGPALGFVISPFDATVRGDFGIRAFTRTFNSAAAGLAVGAATFVIDGGSALLVALGLSANPTLTSRLDSWTTRILNPTTRKKPTGEASTTSGASSTLSDVSLALGVGAGAVILKHPTASRNRWIRLAAVYTLSLIHISEPTRPY